MLPHVRQWRGLTGFLTCVIVLASAQLCSHGIGAVCDHVPGGAAARTASDPSAPPIIGAIDGACDPAGEHELPCPCACHLPGLTAPSPASSPAPLPVASPPEASRNHPAPPPSDLERPPRPV